MIRLWRYWPVRVVVLFPAALFPVVGGLVANGFFFPDGSAAVVAAVAGVFVCAVGWRVAISPLDKAACRKPPAWQSVGQQVWTLAALSLPIVLLATGFILLITLPPGTGPRRLGPEYLVFAILATFPPFLFMLHARPRDKRHWAYLRLCLPAMYAASLAAPFVMYYGGRALFSGDPGPGAAAAIALVAFVYAALNAPFAILLIRSGACALKYELAEEAR